MKRCLRLNVDSGGFLFIKMRLTTEEFIRRAREIHGDKYDYSMVEYKDHKTNVCIRCPIHGNFLQKPVKHLQGRGCPECGRISRVKNLSSNTEEFIEKAKKIHGDDYDYSLVTYIGNKRNVKIVCPKHGVFEQTPNAHLRGAGCPKCYNEKRGKGRQLDTEEFIRRAIEIHGDKYDYSKSEYVTTDKRICIICKEHGEFWQRACDHLKGHGCDKCASKFRNIPKTHEKFLRQAHHVHGNFYSYPDTYKNKDTKIKITCPLHGVFEQNPHNHIQGSGCPKCASERRGNLKRQSTEEFVQRLIEVRGGEGYTFDKVIYKNSTSNITITCEIFGDFEIHPYNFLNGANCPLRTNAGFSVMEKDVVEYVRTMCETIEENVFGIIGRKELDIYIPSLKKAIEFNGEYWHYHPTHFIPGKHAEKSNLCRAKGIKLLHIREDLWKKDKDKMKEVIKTFLNL